MDKAKKKFNWARLGAFMAVAALVVLPVLSLTLKAHADGVPDPAGIAALSASSTDYSANVITSVMFQGKMVFYLIFVAIIGLVISIVVFHPRRSIGGH